MVINPLLDTNISSGSTRKVVFPIIHVYILVSFISMEAYIKWMAARKTEPAETGNGENKSKIISAVISSGFAIQFVIDKAIPESLKGQQFFIFKVFFNNLVFFILAPVAVIFFLGTVNDYSRQFFSSIANSFKILERISNNVARIRKSFGMLSERRVHPVA